MLGHVGAEASAHETRDAEAQKWGSISQLGAEFETLTQAALADRWAAALRASLPAEQAERAIASEVFGPLGAQMHRAAVAGWHVETEFPRLVGVRPLDGVADPAAVLHKRLTRMIDVNPRGIMSARSGGCYVLGMYADATTSISGAPTGLSPSPAMAAALRERVSALEARADELLALAITERQHWVEHLGAKPADPRAAVQWHQAARSVAAYRDRYDVVGPEPFGQPDSITQRRDAQRIATMAAQAHQVAREPHRSLAPTRERPGPELVR